MRTDYFSTSETCLFTNNESSIIKLNVKLYCSSPYAKNGTNWVSISVKKEKVTYFESFNVDNFPKNVEKFLGN